MPYLTANGSHSPRHRHRLRKRDTTHRNLLRLRQHPITTGAVKWGGEGGRRRTAADPPGVLKLLELALGLLHLTRQGIRGSPHRHQPVMRVRVARQGVGLSRSRLALSLSPYPAPLPHQQGVPISMRNRKNEPRLMKVAWPVPPIPLPATEALRGIPRDCSVTSIASTWFLCTTLP